MATAAAAFFAAVGVLLTGSTFGLFSASRSSASSSFSAGTVTASNDQTGVCFLTNLLPDGVAHNCTLKTTYSGSVNGYLGLDVLIETQAGTGGTKLYNPTDGANDLQVTVTSTSPSVTYTVPATATTCPPSAPAGSTCYELDNELVSTTPFTNSSGQVTFTTSLNIPTTSTTGYQGGQAQIVLTAHAVQSANNGTVGGCTVGHTCNGVAWT